MFKLIFWIIALILYMTEGSVGWMFFWLTLSTITSDD